MMEALDRLGAHKVKAEVERMAALFPGGVSEDFEVRNAVIASWPDGDIGYDQLGRDVDDTLLSMMQDLEARLAEHIERHGTD